MIDFDLAGLDTKSASEQGAVMSVFNIDGSVRRDKTGNPVTLTLLGVDSETYRKATRKNLNKRFARRNPGKITAEELDVESLEVLAACTVAWAGIVSRDGAEVPCTPAHAKALYEAAPELRDQADRFINDRANFLLISATA
jgi:hypothetical protein